MRKHDRPANAEEQRQAPEQHRGHNELGDRFTHVIARGNADNGQRGLGQGAVVEDERFIGGRAVGQQALVRERRSDICPRRRAGRVLGNPERPGLTGRPSSHEGYKPVFATVI